MAGEPADEVARRAKEKAERLIRHAEMYERGAMGGREVDNALAGLPPEWTVFSDLHWPGRPRANIDHLVIGPTGVYVIDAKNWSGVITTRGGVLRQNGYTRTVALEGAARAADAIASLVPSLPREVFQPVICFVGDTGADADLAGVMICQTHTIVAGLMKRPVLLTREWLEFLRFEIDMSTRATAQPYVDAGTLTLPDPATRRGRAGKRSRRTDLAPRPTVVEPSIEAPADGPAGDPGMGTVLGMIARASFWVMVGAGAVAIVAKGFTGG